MPSRERLISFPAPFHKKPPGAKQPPASGVTTCGPARPLCGEATRLLPVASTSCFPVIGGSAMRLLCKVLVVLGAGALLAGPAAAQPPGGLGRMGGPMLLTNKSVQEELKLDKDQVAKVDEAGMKMRGKMFEVFQK